MQTITHTLPAEGFVRISQLASNKAKGIIGITPFSQSYIWGKQATGEFPKPVKLSPRISVWRVEDIRAFLKERGLEV